MTSKLKLKWLEAAYLYYLHPEHGEMMHDSEWDKIGRDNGWDSSLFYMSETDYPEEIRNKYK